MPALVKDYACSPVPPGPRLVREDLDSRLGARRRARKKLRSWARRKSAMKKQSRPPIRWITVRGKKVPLAAQKPTVKVKWMGPKSIPAGLVWHSIAYADEEVKEAVPNAEEFAQTRSGWGDTYVRDKDGQVWMVKQ